ncbi:MAG TPA: MFS transporter [Pyrinomonadaceae bacterium]|jgi:FHS family Na+ dependent glucose MFS transporter 1
MSSTATSVDAGPALGARVPARGRVAVYCAAFVALGLTTGALGPTLPGLAAQARVGVGAAGVLFTARSLGFLLGALGGGRAYDRTRGHPVMAGALGAMALLLALTPLAAALWPLALVMLLLGCAEGWLDVGGNTLLTWTHGAQVGPAMNALHFAYGVGAALAPVVVARTAAHGGVAPAYWTLALFMLPAAVWLWRVPSPAPPTIEAPTDETPNARTDGAVYAPVDGATPISVREGVSHTPYRDVARTSSDDAARTPLVALVAVFFFLYLGVEVGFGGWIYTCAVALGLSGADGAAYLTAAFWGALTAGRLLAIPFAARLRPRLLLFVSLVGALLSLAVVLAAAAPAALWAGTLGLGLACASIFPTMMAFAGRHVRLTGRVTGWFLVGASAGGMLVPWLAGRLFARQGPRAVLALVLLDLCAALIVFAGLMRAARTSPALTSARRLR